MINMDDEQPTREVVCTTAGCENAGHSIAVPDDGSPVFCGPCGANITPA